MLKLPVSFTELFATCLCSFISTNCLYRLESWCINQFLSDMWLLSSYSRPCHDLRSMCCFCTEWTAALFLQWNSAGSSQYTVPSLQVPSVFVTPKRLVAQDSSINNTLLFKYTALNDVCVKPRPSFSSIYYILPGISKFASAPQSNSLATQFRTAVQGLRTTATNTTERNGSWRKDDKLTNEWEPHATVMHFDLI